MAAQDLDLGGGHSLVYVVDQDDKLVGALVSHVLRSDDKICAWRGKCMGSISFSDIPSPDVPTWKIESSDPLTLSPSLKCHCGDHGTITAGKWVPAV